MSLKVLTCVKLLHPGVTRLFSNLYKLQFFIEKGKIERASETVSL